MLGVAPVELGAELPPACAYFMAEMLTAGTAGPDPTPAPAAAGVDTADSVDVDVAEGVVPTVSAGLDADATSLFADEVDEGR